MKKLKSRVLLFSCMDSIYNDESLQMNLKLDHSKSDFIEIFDTGTLVTEQLPQVSKRWPRFTLAFDYTDSNASFYFFLVCWAMVAA